MIFKKLGKAQRELKSIAPAGMSELDLKCACRALIWAKPATELHGPGWMIDRDERKIALFDSRGRNTVQDLVRGVELATGATRLPVPFVPVELAREALVFSVRNLAHKVAEPFYVELLKLLRDEVGDPFPRWANLDGQDCWGLTQWMTLAYRSIRNPDGNTINIQVRLRFQAIVEAFNEVSPEHVWDRVPTARQFARLTGGFLNARETAQEASTILGQLGCLWILTKNYFGAGDFLQEHFAVLSGQEYAIGDYWRAGGREPNAYAIDKEGGPTYRPGPEGVARFFEVIGEESAELREVYGN